MECDFIGNDHNLTAACLFLESEVVVSSCKFTNFKGGAIYTVSEPTNDVEIKDCEITKCGVVGAYF